MTIKQVRDSHVDKVFGKFIRIRDNWTCITCGLRAPGDSDLIQPGHFVSRSNYALRWDEKNVNAQCKYCNNHEHSASDKEPYAIALVKKYGQGVLDYLNELKHKAVKVDRRSIYDYYKQKLAEISID